MSNGIRGTKIPSKNKRNAREKRIRTAGQLVSIGATPLFAYAGLHGIKTSLALSSPINMAAIGSIAAIGAIGALNNAYNIKNANKILNKKISKGKKKLKKIGYKLNKKISDYDYSTSYNGSTTRYNTTRVNRYGIKKIKGG